MEDYSNRELDLMFKRIEEKAEDHHRQNMEISQAILEQTKKTNGRVTKLEESQSEFSLWRAGLNGKVWGVGAVSSLVGYGIWQLFLKLII